MSAVFWQDAIGEVADVVGQLAYPKSDFANLLG
jgi:hypothetical protein